MRRRWAKILFCGGWLGTLGLALKAGTTGYGVTPEQLMALIVASYLGVWGLVFFVSRNDRSSDAARFVACTGSILLVFVAVRGSGGPAAGQLSKRLLDAHSPVATGRLPRRPRADLRPGRQPPSSLELPGGGASQAPRERPPERFINATSSSTVTAFAIPPTWLWLISRVIGHRSSREFWLARAT